MHRGEFDSIYFYWVIPMANCHFLYICLCKGQSISEWLWLVLNFPKTKFKASNCHSEINWPLVTISDNYCALKFFFWTLPFPVHTLFLSKLSFSWTSFIIVYCEVFEIALFDEYIIIFLKNIFSSIVWRITIFCQNSRK